MTANKTSLMQDYAEAFSSLRKFVWELVLVLFLVFGLVLFVIEVLRPEVTLDSIEVPEDISRSGYTGIVVAEELADAALNIQIDVRKLSYQSS